MPAPIVSSLCAIQIRTTPDVGRALALACAVALLALGIAERRGFGAAEGDFLGGSMEAKGDWVGRNLSRLRASGEPGWGLRVLANNDPVVRNGHGEEPLRIAGKAYSRGLYCHAVSKVLVELPGRPSAAILTYRRAGQETGG